MSAGIDNDIIILPVVHADNHHFFRAGFAIFLYLAWFSFLFYLTWFALLFIRAWFAFFFYLLAWFFILKLCSRTWFMWLVLVIFCDNNGVVLWESLGNLYFRCFRA